MSAGDGTRQIKHARRNGKVSYLLALLCLFLVLVAAGATVAVAGDPEGQPPGPPTAIEMQEGLNADNSAIYEAELTDLQAAEELPHEDLDRTEALDLLVGVFNPVLEAPAGIFDELDVERFLSANAAIIGPGDQPEPSGVSIGAPPEDRYEGTTLLESTIPLRDESDPGKTEVVDLGLEPEGNGTIAPSNPLVEVSLPQQLGDGIELPEADITVKLEGAPGALSPSTLDPGVAAYPEVAEDTTLAVAPAPGGFETFTLLQSPDAPTSQTFTLDLSAGASLKATLDGGAEVVRNGTPIMGVSPPTALDAAGEDVPASMSVAGNAITLDVYPRASTEFPVLLDPLYETYNWWNGITGLGGWKGSTNFTPNYYTADKATCTTYASPYACQTGVTSNAPGLYIGELPGAAPVNASAAWNFMVPRWDEEWTNHNRPPNSYISALTLDNVGFWHRTDSAPDPTLWMGIWNTESPGWVAGYPRGGNSPDMQGNAQFFFNANGNKAGKIASFAVSNPVGHNLTAFRDAFVSTAIITIADDEVPGLGLISRPAEWLDQSQTNPITATASDWGLGVYAMKVTTPGTLSGIAPIKYTNACTGTSIYPCTGTKTFSAGYDPSTMPQGNNFVSLYFEDPLGNKSVVGEAKLKVDHSDPTVTLSGTLTEQAKLGTTAPEYTLKYEARDGDHEGAAALAPFGGSGATDGKFNRPQGVAIDSSGNIWVVDKNNNRVQKFDDTGKFLLQFGGSGSTDGKFNDPRGIAVSSNGTVWVSDIGNKRVQAFNSQGVFIRKITTEMNMPYGLATGPGGVLWVSDPGTARINKYSESGSYLGKAYGSAANPTGGSDLNYPVGLATDAVGNVWAVDSGNSRLKKYDSNGKFIAQFGTTGTGAGQFQNPLYIDVAPSGHLLVTEELTNRVQVFQPNGVYLRQFGSAGTGNGQFNEPRGIAITADNTALVGDAGNHRVAKWSHADLDRQSGVASTELKVDGNLVETKYAPGCATEDCTISREWTLKAKDFKSGQHTVEVKAIDGVGRPTTKSLTISTVRDEAPPQLTANSAFFTAPEGWLTQKSYVYTSMASDSGGDGVVSMSLKIDGNVVKSMTQSCSSGGCAASLAGTIDLSSYEGGAHPAELVAIDRAGNVASKAWTINVNPQGQIEPPEAASTLEAVEETMADDDAAIVAETEEAEPALEGIEGGWQAAESNVPMQVETDAAGGFTVEPADREVVEGSETGTAVVVPPDEIAVTPIDPSQSATDAEVANEAAAVVANTSAPGTDSIVRPIYDGAMTFQSIREASGPQDYSWEVQLDSDQELKLIDAQHAQVVYDEGHPAFTITAIPAHDATGKAVLTQISAAEGNVLTLHVAHQGGGFVYPVIAGAGWEGGFGTVIAIIPPPEPDLIGERSGPAALITNVSAPEPVSYADAGIDEFPAGERDFLWNARPSGGPRRRHMVAIQCPYAAAVESGKWSCGNPWKKDPPYGDFNTGIRSTYIINNGVAVWHRGGVKDGLSCAKSAFGGVNSTLQVNQVECDWRYKKSTNDRRYIASRGDWHVFWTAPKKDEGYWPLLSQMFVNGDRRTLGKGDL